MAYLGEIIKSLNGINVVKSNSGNRKRYGFVRKHIGVQRRKAANSLVEGYPFMSVNKINGNECEETTNLNKNLLSSIFFTTLKKSEHTTDKHFISFKVKKILQLGSISYMKTIKI